MTKLENEGQDDDVEARYRFNFTLRDEVHPARRIGG